MTMPKSFFGRNSATYSPILDHNIPVLGATDFLVVYMTGIGD